jgi:hypothetical protein
MKWQPIETAPRDGTPILATDGETIVTTRYGAFSWTHEGIDPAVTRRLTHWLPLPPPPKADA